MSSPAIDQILQIAPPSRAATEPVRSTVSDRPAFQDHLARASTATPSPKSTEPVDTDSNDFTSTDQHHDATTSQEDETLIAADSLVGDAEEDFSSKQESEQDAVEISETAVALADSQIQPEDQVGFVPEQSASTLLKSKNLVVDNSAAGDEGNLLDAIDSENEQTNDSASTGKSAVPTKAKVDSTLTEKLEQKSETQAEADISADDTEIQPTVVNKTQDESTDVELANNRKKSRTNGKVVLAGESQGNELPTTENQAAQQPPKAEIDTEVNEPESPLDQKQQPSRKEEQLVSNLQPAAAQTESQTLQEEQNLLNAENRPTVAANASTSDSTSPTTPIPTNLGGEATNFSHRPSAASVVASADVPAEAEPVPTADRARFIQRVGGAIRSAQNRDGEIHLQLRPPELGSLRIEIAVKQGVLTAHLETETSAARAILLDNLPALRERLAEQEIRIDKFDVDVRDESGQQSENPDTQHRRANRPQHENRNRNHSNNEQHVAAPTPTATETLSTLSDGLDVRI